MSRKVTKNLPQSEVQLSFDDLKPGVFIQVPINNLGIGGELLNILSKGLYTNPLDAIREYVQNSIDANTETVEIQVTGNSVFIQDYGDGMDREQLLQAREFGVSRKSLADNVGFRGIGIYSGFDLCNSLRIRTKTKYDDNEHILEFEFGEMRRRLEKVRLDPTRPLLSLSDLISQHIKYAFEKSRHTGISFTIVQLEDLSDSHIHKLSNLDEMEKYILKNLPVRFSETFIYGSQIEKLLRENVPGYKSARVILKVEAREPIIVEKPNVPDILPPQMGFVLDGKNRKIAYYWACLTSKSDRIKGDVAGLIYKLKGFTIGNRERLLGYFSRPQVYYWWTGEVYVVANEIIPTSARDDFEAGPSKDNLEVGLRNLLNGGEGSLQKIALDAQVKRRADSVIAMSEQELVEIEKKFASGNYQGTQLLTTLHDFIEKVKPQKNKASDKSKANTIFRKANELYKRVEKDLSEQTPTSYRKKQYAKEAMQDAPKTEDAPATESTSGAYSKTGESAAYTETQPEEEEISFALLDVIKRSGWMVNENDVTVIEAIGNAISDHLGVDSESYKILIRDIEARLTDLIER